jgi:hypothetical protein
MTHTGEWIGEAWDKVVKGGNLGKFALLALGYILISGVIQGSLFFFEYPGVRSLNDFRAISPRPFLQDLPFELLGIFIGGVIFSPLIAAIYAIILNFLRTGEMDFNHYSDISPIIGQIVFAGIVIGLFEAMLSQIWSVFGAIITIFYLFTLPLLVAQKLSFWQAMEASRKMVLKSLLGFIWFDIVVGFAVALGILVFGVGLLVSVPIGWVTLLVAYRELWPEPAPGAAPEQI